MKREAPDWNVRDCTRGRRRQWQQEQEGKGGEGQDVRGEKRRGQATGPDGDTRLSTKAKDRGIYDGQASNPGQDQPGQEAASRQKDRRTETLDSNILG